FSNEQESAPRNWEAVEGYQFMKYTVDQDELHLFSVDRALVLQAGRDGHLAGTIVTYYSEDGENSEELRISASSEKIQEFLEGGGTLFGAEPNQSYQRMND